MRLGQFSQDKKGSFQGTIKAYGLPETKLVITPRTSQSNELYFEIVGDPEDTTFDGGKAFPKQKGDMEYLSIALDSPLFTAPINAALFQDKTNPAVYNLVWDRRSPKPEYTVENKEATEPDDEKKKPISKVKKTIFHALGM